jgi:prepilin-type processing-associated H-X9-DG protein
MLGIMQYTQDYDEKTMPEYNKGKGATSVFWPYMIQAYTKSYQIFDCPSGTSPNYSGIYSDANTDYGVNTLLFEEQDSRWSSHEGVPLAQIVYPSATVMITDSLNMVRSNPQGFKFSSSAYDIPSQYPQYRHLETTNVGFFDGHVKTMRKSALEVIGTTENGAVFSATDDNRFLLWNKY